MESDRPPDPGRFKLTAKTFTRAGTDRAKLTWLAQPNTTTYTVWFNGTMVGSTTATKFTHNTRLKGHRSGTYQVCGNAPTCPTVSASW